jgi:hypothetical protein
MSESSRRKTVRKQRQQGIDPNDMASQWLKQRSKKNKQEKK